MRLGVSSSIRIALLGLASCSVVACSFEGEGERARASSRAEPRELAREVSATYIEQNAADLRAMTRDAALFEKDVTVDHMDLAHIRYGQLYKGVPVFEGQIITHVDVLRREIVRVTDALAVVDDALDVAPSISDDDAAVAALAEAGLAIDADAETELMVLASRGVASPKLTYRVYLTGDAEEGPVDEVVFIDAHTGQRVWGYDNLHTAKPGGGTTGGTAASGTGKTLYLGDVPISTRLNSGQYDLTDLTRGGMYVTNMKNGQTGSGVAFVDADNIWGNNTSADAATAGAEALFGAEMTWDYYANTFGRQGIYNDGKGSLNRVHYGNNYNNAFWSDSCKCMTYGDGDGAVMTPLVALDVAGHEMTHGVTSATAALVYSGESGGLNEAMSDIFGTMVEFYAAANGASKAGNYWIGEDIYTPFKASDALRYMDTPRKDGRSIDHYSQYVTGMDVHYSSGLANQVFYLLSEGGTNATSGQSVTAIGRDNAAAIFYRALTVYMTSGTTFAGARQATLDAAADLFGAGSTTVSHVAAAWSACGVN